MHLFDVGAVTGLSMSTQNAPHRDVARSGFPRGSPRTRCCRTPRNLTLSASKSNRCSSWLVPGNPAGFVSALAHGSCPTCAETPSSSHERCPRWTGCQLCSLGAARAPPDCRDNICSLQVNRCCLKLHMLGAQKVDEKVLVVRNSSPSICTLPWSCTANTDGFGSRCSQPTGATVALARCY